MPKPPLFPRPAVPGWEVLSTATQSVLLAQMGALVQQAIRNPETIREAAREREDSEDPPRSTRSGLPAAVHRASGSRTS
jgi:hypothetical protein